MNCEPKNERYMPHKIEQPNVAVKALGDNELADWVERIASAPNIGLLDEYKSYLRECAARMKERGERLKKLLRPIVSCTEMGCTRGYARGYCQPVDAVREVKRMLKEEKAK